MSLLLHIIVTYIKENIITNYKNYTACPETLRQAVNHLCYLWKNLFAQAIYHLHAKYSLKGLHKAKKIEICKWPVAITGDGCLVNTAAGNVATKIELTSTNMRCESHAADGSYKRMTDSKNMNISAVAEFFPSFQNIMKHFKISGKSSCVLNDALVVLRLMETHMMSLCPTRMAYLLSKCS